MKTTFLDWLEEKFIGLDEIGGVPITKDNCEDMFDTFLSEQDVEDMITWANLYGEQMFLKGQRQLLAELKKK